MSIFTKIIQGELPCYKIFEDDLTFSFLALDQINPGHTLIIPKKEVNHWFEVSEAEYLRVHQNALKIGQAIHQATKSQRVLTATVGFEVPHFHLHLIPAWSMADLDFKKAKRLPAEEMTRIQKEIIQFIK